MGAGLGPGASDAVADRMTQAIMCLPDRPELQRLVGARGGNHLRSAPGKALPAEQATGSPLYLFIDDLAVHHGSVSETAPDVFRLHFCGEPLLAPHIDCAHRAGHAHARIDDWASAAPWLLDRLNAEETL